MTDSRPDFARLIRECDSALRRYVMTFIPRRDDVDEIIQRTAVVLWEKFDEYDPQREFGPWACRFAYFEVLNYRKELARSRLFYSPEAMAAVAESRSRLEPELESRSAILDQCLDSLADPDRQLLIRRYCESRTVKSLASESGKTVKALYRRLDRVRELLSQCVERKYVARAAN